MGEPLSDDRIHGMRERVNHAYYEQQGAPGGWAGHYHRDVEDTLNEVARLKDRIEQAEALASRLSKKRDDRYELAAEKKIALTRLARVRALHEPVTVYEIDSLNGTWVYENDERKVIGHLCQECTDDDTLADLEDEGWQDDGRSVPYPCATIRALEGATDE